MLAKERTLLRLREEILECALEDAIQVMQATVELDQEKANHRIEEEANEVEQLKFTNMALIQKLQAEKAVNERELE